MPDSIGHFLLYLSHAIDDREKPSDSRQTRTETDTITSVNRPDL